ncbi:hypothetical protein [Geminicoccus flavidas]|uniref:hypothetical protein n=1 Tax=Geminicoccus flavidas TaxID=2506407 RepID=UPI00190F8F49|nr:hypothetical protein [Geminicoccus flavidas]
MKLIGPGALFDQEDVVPAVHGFVEAYRRTRPAARRGQHGRLCHRPGDPDGAGGGGGRPVRPEKRFRQVLLEHPIETVIGPMHFDPRNNQAVLDIYVNELVAGPDGLPLNRVITPSPPCRIRDRRADTPWDSISSRP